MCKSAAKQRWLEVGVLTPDFVLAHAIEPMVTITDRAHSLSYPLVVKPDSLGSSLGVQIVDNDDQLQNAFAECQLYDPCVIAERYIKGREFTVTLIESRPLPLIEIITAGQVFTYQAKYQTTPNSPEPGTSENHSPITRSFPTDLTGHQIDQIEQTAVAAAEALGTTGLVRVDLMLSSADEVDEVFVLEVNTSPGMTEQSLTPQAAFQDGIDMPTLCDYLVRQCLAQEALR
jgi:D-alanine-D-alanine ligase